MTKTIKFGEWQDDLLWCPSQCYNYFRHEGKKYCLYLRWRHKDPWAAYLVYMPRGVDSIIDTDKWVTLEVPFIKDIDVDAIKKAAIEAVKKHFETLNIKQ